MGIQRFRLACKPSAFNLVISVIHVEIYIYFLHAKIICPGGPFI